MTEGRSIDGFHDIGDLVGQSVGPASSRMLAVVASWTRAMGPDVARHATPVAVRRGELVLSCTSAAWASELQLMDEEIRTRLAAVDPSLAELRRIVARGGRTPAAPPPGPVPKQLPPATDRTRDAVEDLVRSLPPGPLRDRVRDAALAAARRNAADT